MEPVSVFISIEVELDFPYTWRHWGLLFGFFGVGVGRWAPLVIIKPEGETKEVHGGGEVERGTCEFLELGGFHVFQLEFGGDEA